MGQMLLDRSRKMKMINEHCIWQLERDILVKQVVQKLDLLFEKKS